DFEQTRLVVLSGTAVFQGSMELLAGQAKTENGKQGILDLAMFHCSSCHHELKKSGRISGSSGRPRPPAWPGTLLSLALRHTAGADPQQFAARQTAHADHLQALHEALAARPR